MRGLIPWMWDAVKTALKEVFKPITGIRKREARPGPVRYYNRREVVLPSGRFAAMSEVRWADVIVAQDDNGLVMLTKLAAQCVAIDGEPLTLEEALHIDAREMYPIVAMLGQEASELLKHAKGIA